MKALSRMALLAGLFCLLAAPAMANITAVLTGGHGAAFGSPINGIGGYYEVNLYGAGTDYKTPFRTFCVEDTYFYLNKTYNVTIEDTVRNQGPPILQVQTQNLYALYLQDASTVGWTAIGEDGNRNRAIQALIWDYQGVFGTNGAFDLLTTSEKALYNSFKTFNESNTALNNAASGVVAMNLWDPNGGGDAQSQLILGPPITVNVPVPAALALAMLGLGLVGWTKRRLA